MFGMIAPSYHSSDVTLRSLYVIISKLKTTVIYHHHQASSLTIINTNQSSIHTGPLTFIKYH